MGESSLLTEIGVGGIFAILVIRMVLEYLGKEKRNGKSGEKDPAYWQQEFRAAVDDETAEHFREIKEHFREIKALLGKVLDRLK